ncbi:MAG: hypothetical protein OEZ20_03395, partial [candidate division WOR-3 bacterium]|nr:hypothetical protein [candidate division WOR-3 bacterium]
MQGFNLDYIQTLQSRVLISKFLFLGIMLLFVGLFASPTEMKEIPFHVNGTIEKGTLYRQSATQSVKGVPRGASRNSNPATRTGEFLIDTNIVYLPSSVKEENPEVGFDGTNYLVVWQDIRNAPSSGYDIYGCRVNQNGIVLDPDGIVISTVPYLEWNPSVIFGGTNHFVVWDLGEVQQDILFARVNRDGVVLDPNGIAISTVVNEQYYPSAAFDGTNYLVVWIDRRGRRDVYGARVNQNGIVLDPNGIAICTSAYYLETVSSIAFDGTNYFLLCGSSRGYDVYGVRVNQAGIVLDTNGIPIIDGPGPQVGHSIAFDGTNYFVIWLDLNTPTPDLYGARVNQDGVVLDTNGIPICTTFVLFDSQVAFDGTNYLVVWTSNAYDITGSRVNQDGVVLDTNSIPISTAIHSQWAPAIAFDGTNFFVVWRDERSSFAGDIYGARVTQEGVVLDTNGIPISTVRSRKWSPAVAFDGTNYLVVWTD